MVRKDRRIAELTRALGELLPHVHKTHDSYNAYVKGLITYGRHLYVGCTEQCCKCGLVFARNLKRKLNSGSS